jgi:hypothetical protein
MGTSFIHKGQMRHAYTFFLESLKWRDWSEDVAVNGRILL